MQKSKMNRREFLKLGALGLGSLALPAVNLPPVDTIEKDASEQLARIAIASVSVYSQPWDQSKIRFQRYRDEVVNLYYKVTATHGPEWNPIWFRVWGGYIHSRNIQYVDNRLNPIPTSIRKDGQLAEVTVPIVHPMINRGNDQWEPNYPLYYQSVHWVVDLVKGPDGLPWYRIKEAWGGQTYDVPASALRLIPDEELTPLSPEVPPEKKRIEVSLVHQTLTAYEGDKAVLQTKVSTGQNYPIQEGQIPWETPGGTWRIGSKMPSQHMGNGNVTSNVADYELLGVPWVCFFHPNGNATHGTYWHNNFGNPMSHGCVNMRMQDALWIFRWSTPVWEPGQREKIGNGTPVIVS